MADRQLPSDERAEREVLAACLLDNTQIDEVAGVVGPQDWWSPRHAAIWEAMTALAAASKAVDTVSLRGELMRQGKLAAAGGDEFVLALTDALPDNVETHARTVAELAAVRRVAKACGLAWGEAHQPIESPGDYIDRVESTVFAAAQSRVSRDTTALFSDVSADQLEKVLAASAAGRPLQGVPTGFRLLDRMTTGLQPGDLWIVAGRPGMGKTGLAQHIALAASRATVTVMFSLEMPKEQLANRCLSTLAGVPLQSIRLGMIADAAIAPLAAAVDELRLHHRLVVDDQPGLTISQCRAKCRRVAKKHGPIGLVIVDYLQLMEAVGETRDSAVGALSRGLKLLAKEMGCAVIALSQLNRNVEYRSDKRPQLADLRESGSIEQDADAILFVYRDEVYDQSSADRGIAELIVGKQRNGATGTIKCAFSGEYMRFADLAPQAHAPEEYA